MDRVTVLTLGLLPLLLADLPLAFAPNVPVLAGRRLSLGAAHGIHSGTFRSPDFRRGASAQDFRDTAFGVFNLITGLALLLASVSAGALCDVVGPAGTFLAGAALTVATAAGLMASSTTATRIVMVQAEC